MKKGIIPVIAVVIILALMLVIIFTTDKSNDIVITSYDWKSYFKQSEEWFKGDEAEAVARDVLKYQLSDGGWRKDMANEEVTGSWAKSTVDNDATTSQIRFLAKIYEHTGKNPIIAEYLSGFFAGLLLTL